MCRGRRPHSSTAWPAARERHSDKRRLQKIFSIYFNGTVEFNSDIFTTDNSKHIIRLNVFTNFHISTQTIRRKTGLPNGGPCFLNRGPRVTEWGNRSPKWETRFPAWGTLFHKKGPGFPKGGPRFWVGIIICFIVAFRRKKNRKFNSTVP